MPADHGFRADDYEMLFPARPDSGKHDPERTIERREPRSRPIMAVDRELLAWRQLHDGLLLTASEQGEKTTKESGGEGDQHSHGEAILRDRWV